MTDSINGLPHVNSVVAPGSLFFFEMEEIDANTLPQQPGTPG